MDRTFRIVDTDRIDWPRVLLASLAAALGVTLVVAGATSSAAFGAYNPSWDGTSDFRQQITDEPGIEGDLARDASVYDEAEPNGTVVFVVAPDERYEGEDAERVAEFVEDGGTLVVLENFGENGNSLLIEVGAEARTDGRLLRDLHHNHRGPTMPVATGVGEHSLTEGVDRLTLNHATAVEPGGATVLVTTSDFGYLGEDGDGFEGIDRLERQPVATVEDVDDGEVIVVGDPSISINAMIDEPDNRDFLRNLYADEERVVLDVSHAGGVPPLVEVTLAIRESPLLQVFVGGVAVAVVGALGVVPVSGTLERVWRRVPARYGPGERDRTASSPGLSAEERVEYLRRRYPEWDEKRIERVTTALNHTRVQRGEDE